MGVFEADGIGGQALYNYIVFLKAAYLSCEVSILGVYIYDAVTCLKCHVVCA